MTDPVPPPLKSPWTWNRVFLLAALSLTFVIGMYVYTHGSVSHGDDYRFWYLEIPASEEVFYLSKVDGEWDFGTTLLVLVEPHSMGMAHTD